MRSLILISVVAGLCTAQAPRLASPMGDVAVQRRVALLIGNAHYISNPLRNPINDIESMESALKRLGFQVTTLKNSTLEEMDSGSAQFAAKLKEGDLALFYYSGHGIQIDQENYLIPVDFRASSASDVRYRALSAALIRDRLEESKARLRILVLDACRDNPFRSTRGGPRGLSPMSSHAEGTLIAFATADSQIADDNPSEPNGLYTKHLLTSLATSGLSLKQVFNHTRDLVYFGSGRKQRPYSYDGIVGDLPLTPGSAANATMVSQLPPQTWREVHPPTGKPLPVWEQTQLGAAGSVLRYDGATWSPLPQSGRERVDLSGNANGLRAIFLLEDIQSPIESLVERAIHTLGGPAAVQTLRDDTQRKAFGLVRALRLRRDQNEYWGYYHSSAAGSLQVLVFGRAGTLEDEDEAIQTLVSGLSLKAR